MNTAANGGGLSTRTETFTVTLDVADKIIARQPRHGRRADLGERDE